MLARHRRDSASCFLWQVCHRQNRSGFGSLVPNHNLWFSPNPLQQKRRSLNLLLKSLGRGGLSCSFAIDVTPRLAFSCRYATSKTASHLAHSRSNHILTYRLVWFLQTLHKVNRTITKVIVLFTLGRGGFEPPYTRVNRFTVCRL